jgi:hypothetical protein
MNDDDSWLDALRSYTYQTSSRDWSWTVDQARTMDPKLTTQQIYDWLKQLDSYNRKDTDMAYSYSRGYYNDTRGDEVATAVLEAYSNGVDFETLIRKNAKVRQYWYQIQSEKAAKAKKAEQEKVRKEKAAEKKRLEDAARAEVVAKLTPEELAAFGLNKKGYHR